MNLQYDPDRSFPSDLCSTHNIVVTKTPNLIAVQVVVEAALRTPNVSR